MSDEQQLNSVERFRKQPGRLILEEHSHCEVPAGCGGVVLRWRNPFAAVPVTVRLYSPTKATFLVDGVAPTTGRIDLSPGRHVFGFLLENAELSAGLFLFAAVHEPKARQGTVTVVEQPLKVLSDDRGGWKFCLDAPPDDWGTVAFNDSDWLALVRVSPPQLAQQDAGYWSLRRCTDLGAVCLGLPRPPRAERGIVWVRRVFEVPVPQVQG